MCHQAAGLLLTLVIAAAAAAPAAAQVSLDPAAVEPGTTMRLAVRAVTASDAPTVAVRVEVPEAVVVLGLDAPAGWRATWIEATDSTSRAIEWAGGPLARAEFREFAFLVRVPADVRRGMLVFPVALRAADGTVRAWRPDGVGPAPAVEIRGRALVTPGAAFALAGGAVGLAILAIGLALSRPRVPPAPAPSARDPSPRG